MRNADIPTLIPRPYRSVQALAKYLKEKTNYDFDPYSKTLIIKFQTYSVKVRISMSEDRQK